MDRKVGWAFDLDGTLIHSEEAWREAEAATLRAYGGTDDTLPSLVGLDVRASAGVLAERAGVADVEQVADRLAAEFAARCDSVPAAPGAAHVLALAREAGAGIAVVSNTLPGLCRRMLAACGLLDAVDIVRGPGNGRPKPAPDLYARACVDLGVAAARTVAVEDSPLGMQAARAAGLYVIGVGTAGHDATVASLDEIDVEAVTARLMDRHAIG